VFGALAQYERALVQSASCRLAAGLRRGRIGGRPRHCWQKLDTIITALNGGMSKAAVCRNLA
jgi:hypothetical protein